MILLDANVLSEIVKPTAAPAVREWLNRQHRQALFLSSITIAEMAFGIGIMPEGKKRHAIWATAQDAFSFFGTRILPFDADAARRYAELALKARAAGLGFPIPDGYIAAIASARGFAVATRDGSAFAAAGLSVIDPWKTH